MSDDIRDEQLSRLYRETADAAPPEALDRAILAAARAGVAPPRRRAGWRSWTVPMSVAATVVLTVTLTLMVQEEQEPLVPEAAPAADVPRASVGVPQKKADAAADLAVKPAAPREAKQEAVKRETEGPAVAPAPVPEAGGAAPPPPPPAPPGGAPRGGGPPPPLSSTLWPGTGGGGPAPRGGAGGGGGGGPPPRPVHPWRNPSSRWPRPGRRPSCASRPRPQPMPSNHAPSPRRCARKRLVPRQRNGWRTFAR